MESVSLSQAVNPVIGFTLELDGDPTEVQRVLAAIGKEMDAIRHDNWKEEDQNWFSGSRRPLFPLGRLNIRGMIHFRKGF